MSTSGLENSALPMRPQLAHPHEKTDAIMGSDDRHGHDTNSGKRTQDRNLVVRVGIGALVGVVSFAALGTVAAVWDNPFFIRMTPVQGFEIPLLAAMSVLFGLYVVVRRPTCGIKFTGFGGVLGFVGIACPICNKVLLLLFGGELLMLYLEPNRLWFSLAGIAMVGGAVALELWKRRSNVEGTKKHALDRLSSEHRS